MSLSRIMEEIDINRRDTLVLIEEEILFWRFPQKRESPVTGMLYESSSIQVLIEYGVHVINTRCNIFKQVKHITSTGIVV